MFSPLVVFFVGVCRGVVV